MKVRILNNRKTFESIIAQNHTFTEHFILVICNE